jgi:signal transduction histidine kinase/HD-like signal output (HDOD) protein
MSHDEAHRARRLELILQQLESLPTLPGVAMRLLQITQDDDSDAKQVIDLVQSDPALTSKVLAMCRTADKGLKSPITTVDRAVVLLGFDAIRNAVLSIKVFEVFAEESAAASTPASSSESSPAASDTPVPDGFNRPAFWRHSLAVATLCELIAAAHPQHLQPYTPSEAFVCGLLHDIGKLAAEHLLPKSYERVVQLTQQHQLNIADVERKVIGLDHHTIGKHLAEHWQMPHLIQDSIWLHGSPTGTLPDLPHRRLIDIVTVADLAVRRQHLGFSGNFELSASLEQLARDAGLDPVKVHRAVDELHDELGRRADAMGLGQTPSRQMFMESIMQANAVLGRLNRQLDQGRRTAASQRHALKAITEFHDSARRSRNLHDVLSSVTSSAAGVLGRGYYAIVYQGSNNQPWLFNQYSSAGRLVHSDLLTPPPQTPNLSQLMAGVATSVNLLTLMPWLSQSVISGIDVRSVNLLGLPCPWGVAAVLLHPIDRPDLPAEDSLHALLHTWGSAIAATTQHQGARRIGEQLVETTRRLTQMQDRMLHEQAMARLGEMAAGAAHEMNNPLAVISGRAQLLASRLPGGSREQADAEQIWRQSEKLSDLITAMRLFAEPPPARRTPVVAADLLESAIHLLMQREPSAPALRVSGIDDAPALQTDPGHTAAALAELLINAVQAKPKTGVRVAASVDPVNDRFLIKVIDDGVGMDAATLQHAFDPFFSAKPAGRQVGLGLARAKRLLECVGGDIDLASEASRGTVATLSLPLSSAAGRDEDEVPAVPIDLR